jgi:hypothetical protein
MSNVGSWIGDIRVRSLALRVDENLEDAGQAFLKNLFEPTAHSGLLLTLISIFSCIISWVLSWNLQTIGWQSEYLLEGDA